MEAYPKQPKVGLKTSESREVGVSIGSSKLSFVSPQELLFCFTARARPAAQDCHHECRSRSVSADIFQTRGAGDIAAHRRNLAQRRGGQKCQAQLHTRAIHRHLLQILIEYLGQLLAGFTRCPPPTEVRARKRQAEVQ